MAMAQDSIPFRCSKCGGSRMVFPNDSPKDDDIISCAGCGVEIGRYADVRTAAIEAGKAEINKLLERTFGTGVKTKWTRR